MDPAPVRVVSPFQVLVPDPVLEDLRARLARARVVADVDNDDWRYGVERGYLLELLDYWSTRYDWRAREAEINALPQFRVELDGVPVHFVHRRGVGPAPIPIVLSHGWPLTFWDFHEVIGPLSDPAAHGGDPDDAFDVVVPSLPGFAFSSPLDRSGLNYWSVAPRWVTLMRDVLGYERFAAHGGDFGARISAQLGHAYPEHMIGIHLTQPVGPLDSWATDRPWADRFGELAAHAAPEHRAEIVEWEMRHASHLAVNVQDPQTLAYALNDSPVGLAAWLVQRRQAWSDCNGDVEHRFSKDDLLTTVMLFWITQTAGTAARWYADAVRAKWRPAHDRRPVVEAPTGVSLFCANEPPHTQPNWDSIASYHNLVFRREHARGGHFPALEEPALLVDDIRETFRPLR